MSQTIRIGGINCPSLIDWEGMVVCTIFTAGCNYNCPYCHNGNLIPIGSGEEWNIHKLTKEIADHKPFIDGVVICGGEPTIHMNSLVELCSAIKELDLLIKIDTNGSNPGVIEQLCYHNLVDKVAVDVKGGSPYEYRLSTGVNVDMKAVLQTLQVVRRYGKELEARTTLVPTINAYPTSVIDMARIVAPYATEYVLQKFIPDNAKEKRFRDLLPLDNDVMEWFKLIAEEQRIPVKLRLYSTLTT